MADLLLNIHPKLLNILTEKIFCPVCKEQLNTENKNTLIIACVNNTSQDNKSNPNLLFSPCPIDFRILSEPISLRIAPNGNIKPSVQGYYRISVNISNFRVVFDFNNNTIQGFPDLPFPDPSFIIDNIPNNLEFTKESLESQLKLWLTFS